jgi:predicted nucleic acid-binding protein
MSFPSPYGTLLPFHSVAYFTVLKLNARGEEYAHIKYALRKKGKPVDEFDMLIAAHAVAVAPSVLFTGHQYY